MNEDLFSDLNEQQKSAVFFKGKHLLVLAGAGTGKTKTIISRALYLVQQGVRPYKILILSFTRKSAQEIVSRINSYSLNSTGITGQTFHSWCMNIIKRNPTIFECSDYTCLDEEDRESIFKLLCGKNFKDNDGERISPSSIINVYSYAVNAKCALTDAIRCKVYSNSPSATTSQKISSNKSIYENIIKKYIHYKNEHRYIDYDDMLNIVSVGLKKNINAANFIASQYDHILIDEMQDTNPLQYELLSSFYDYCHLFCVGDDAQSIYGFRGADFKTMHNFVNIVSESEAIQLSLNYRSTQEILDCSNWLLKQSPLNYNKKLVAYRGNGDKPILFHVENDWDEANHITDDILISVKENGFNFNDNLVLSRSLFGLKKVEACCLTKKIPYQIFGGVGLMQSKHVRDVIAALRISSNFRDEIAWMRYLCLWKGIGEVYASRIINQLYDCKSFQECISKLKLSQVQKEIYNTLSNIEDLQTNPSSAIKKALNSMDKRLSELYKDEWEVRKTDFNILEEVAQNNGSITEFISEYVIDPKVGTYSKGKIEGENAVTLSTIHSAKGLEANNCYIVDVSPNSYPNSRAISNGIDSIEEERRCLYVAMTRAKDKLYIYRNIRSVRTQEKTTNIYEGDIHEGDSFVQNKFNEKVAVKKICKEGNIIYVYVTLENGSVTKMDDWFFRRAYSPMKEKSMEKDCYFLNNIEDDIVDVKVLSNEKMDANNQYTGEIINNTMSNFNFD